MLKRNIFFMAAFICGLTFVTSFCFAGEPNEEPLNKREIVMRMIEEYRISRPDYDKSDYHLLGLLRNSLLQQIVGDKIKAYKRTYPDSGLTDNQIFELFNDKDDKEVPEVKYEEGEKESVTSEEIVLLQTSDDDLLEVGGSEKDYLMKKIEDFRAENSGFNVSDYDILDYFKARLLGVEAVAYFIGHKEGNETTDVREHFDIENGHKEDLGFCEKCREFLLKTTHKDLLGWGGDSEQYNEKIRAISKGDANTEMERVRTEIEINRNYRSAHGSEIEYQKIRGKKEDSNDGRDEL